MLNGTILLNDIPIVDETSRNYQLQNFRGGKVRSVFRVHKFFWGVLEWVSAGDLREAPEIAVEGEDFMHAVL